MEVNLTVHGNLTIHGVTKEIKAPASLTFYKENERTKARMMGNLIKGSTDFSIKLSDYGVEIPSMVVGKVDNNIKISLRFIASDAK